MKSKWLRSALVIVIALLFTAPPCWAKAKGYCYVIGYCYKQKKVYSTAVFKVKVRNKSYNDTEYVTDIGLQRKLEAQFLSHITARAGVDGVKFTIAPRGAYKTPKFAGRALAREKEEFAAKGFYLMDMPDFKFKK